MENVEIELGKEFSQLMKELQRKTIEPLKLGNLIRPKAERLALCNAEAFHSNSCVKILKCNNS